MLWIMGFMLQHFSSAPQFFWCPRYAYFSGSGNGAADSQPQWHRCRAASVRSWVGWCGLVPRWFEEKLEIMPHLITSLVSCRCWPVNIVNLREKVENIDFSGPQWTPGPWIGQQKLSPETCVWPLVLFLREHRVHLATSTQALSEIQVLKQLWCSPPQEEMPFVSFCGEREVAGSYSDYSVHLLFVVLICFDMLYYCCIFLGIWSTSWSTSWSNSHPHI